MKKLLRIIPVTLLLIVSLTACSPDNAGIESGGTTKATEKTEDVQVINSSESSLSMEFPKSWSETELNEGSSIQMALLSKEQYMIVMEESTTDFADDFTLDDYTSVIMTNMLELLEEGDSSEIKDITIGSGVSAKQFEISGTIENIKVTYLITCALENDTYYQISAWSLQSKYDEAKTVFNTILNSVKF